MVSCRIQGGIGNSLFIISTVLAYSMKHGIDYCIPTKNDNPHYQDHNTIRFQNIKYCDDKPSVGTRYIYKEQFFHYREIPKINCANIVLSGYFQSIRYFDDYKEEILRLFEFDNIKTVPDVCAIHYRSGDYKNLPTKHPVISEDYLKSAIQYMWFNGYKKFWVYSDAVDEIRKIINSFTWFPDLKFSYSVGKTELEDLKEMASCSSIITANSSFSWWAAYINPNPDKIVIMPLSWFGPDLRHSMVDLYLPNAILR